MEVIQKNKKSINKIIAALKNGAVLVLPTDTVYGLVCDATNHKAVEKIFAIKQRDRSKALPVFVENVTMAKKYAIADDKQEKFLNKNWPGAVTVVLKRKEGLSSLVYKDDTIAMRQPNYKLITDVVGFFGKPLAQTSANISEQPPLTEIDEVIKTFSVLGSQPDIIINAGDLLKNKPSKIIDLTAGGGRVLRY